MSCDIHTFCRGMDRFFGIRGANRFLDEIFLQLRREVRIDVIKFDDWLHAKHGEYENDGQSMEEVITKHYGEPATTFIRSLI
jgi:hypothetical protein